MKKGYIACLLVVMILCVVSVVKLQQAVAKLNMQVSNNEVDIAALEKAFGQSANSALVASSEAPAGPGIAEPTLVKGVDVPAPEPVKVAPTVEPPHFYSPECLPDDIQEANRIGLGYQLRPAYDTDHHRVYRGLKVSWQNNLAEREPLTSRPICMKIGVTHHLPYGDLTVHPY